MLPTKVGDLCSEHRIEIIISKLFDHVLQKALKLVSFTPDENEARFRRLLKVSRNARHAAKQFPLSIRGDYKYSVFL